MCGAAAQCVGSGQSSGGAPALGDGGQGALPAAEGRTATAAGPGPKSQGKRSETCPDVYDMHMLH